MTDKTKLPLKNFFVLSDTGSRMPVVAASFGFTEQGVHFRDELGVLTAFFPAGMAVMSDDAQRVLVDLAPAVDSPKPAVTELACGEAFAVDLPPSISIGAINITGVTPENAASLVTHIQGLMDVHQSAGVA